MAITDADALDILRIPEVARLPEMAAAVQLFAGMGGRPGCSRCRRRRLRPETLAPTIGAALLRALRAGRGRLLYNAIASRYSIQRSVQLRIGPCVQVLNRS